MLYLLLTVSLILLCQPSAAAREVTVRVAWGDLRPLVHGEEISVRTANGTRIKGRVRDVEPNALVLEGRRQRRVSRNDFAELILIKYPVNRWRRAGTGAGIVGGLLGGVIAVLSISDETTVVPGSNKQKIQGAAAFLGIFGGSILGGYLLGRRADREVTRIVPIPTSRTVPGASSAPSEPRIGGFGAF